VGEGIVSQGLSSDSHRIVLYVSVSQCGLQFGEDVCSKEYIVCPCRLPKWPLTHTTVSHRVD
jgi:hypothetical protein